MKKNVLITLIVFFTLISCQKNAIKNVSFDDDFVAKNLIGVQCDFPENSRNGVYLVHRPNT